MKILVISSNVFPVPLTGYGGLEQIAFWQATGLAAKGHQVSIVAPEGSQLPEAIEHIKTVCKEPENVSWQKYKDRLEKGEFDTILDHSIDGATPILVRYLGKWINTNIGSLIEHLLTILPTWSKGETLVADLPADVLAIHSISEGKVVVLPVRQVSRHKADDLWRIQTTRGHEVLATGQHALMEAYGRSWKKHRPIAASAVARGQHLVSVAALPCELPETPFLPLALSGGLQGFYTAPDIKADIWLHRKDLTRELVATGVSPANAYARVKGWRRTGKVPIRLLPVVGGDSRQDARISGHHGSSVTWPIKLTDDLLTLFGLWLGDGCYQPHNVSVEIDAGADPELLSILDSVAAQFGAKVKSGSLRPDVRQSIHSTVLCQVMRGAGFNGHATTKRIPGWVFNLSDRQVGALLRGYFYADAGFRRTELALISAHRALLEDARVLLWRLGIDNCLRPSSSQGGYSTGRQHWELCVSQAWYEQFLQRIGWISNKGRQRLAIEAADRAAIVRTVLSGVRTSKVQKVTQEMPPSSGYVYDLSIPGPETFVANGLLVKNSWEKWSYVSSAFRDPNLPIIGVLHSSPMVYSSLPKVQWPCFVGISEQHCTDIRLHLRCDARRVYNGLDLAFYTPDKNIKCSERYLFLGRYTPEKGPLRAIDLARKLRVPLDCVGDTNLVGDAGYVERCRNACDGLMVRFMTEVPRSETVKLYRNHKALISPIDWSEPFSLVHAEAAACGLPVLTLNKGAAPEVVKHGVSGFVFDNIEQMEQAIKEDWAAKIKPEDCRTVAEGFSLQRMVDGYEQLCQEVMQGHRW